MKFLLDTCAVSDFIKGEINTLQKIKSLSPIDIAISSITIMELNYGLALNPAKAKILVPIIENFLKVVSLLGFNKEEATISGNIRADLKKQGLLIGYYDILLAATALHHQLIFVTSNTNEFKRIPNLVLEDWRLI